VLGIFDEPLHEFLRNGNSLAAREFRVGFVKHRKNFETPAFALFPQRQRVLNGILFAGEAIAFYVRGMEPGGLSNLIGLVLVVVCGFKGTLVLAGRRSGYVIILVGSLLGAGIPVIQTSSRPMVSRYGASEPSADPA
jgi:hypothetical protein